MKILNIVAGYIAHLVKEPHDGKTRLDIWFKQYLLEHLQIYRLQTYWSKGFGNKMRSYIKPSPF